MVGSSPRPWGTLGVAEDDLPLARFIPTPVGNTRPAAFDSAAGAVHPHARGEHTELQTDSYPKAGSSQRPWGTLAEDAEEGWNNRFIPTPVGNTATRSVK